MRGLTRREALAAALGGVAILGGVGTSRVALAADARDTLPRIPVIRSRNGVLQATLTATTAPALIMGVETEGLYTYDGRFVGPCLMASPGDRVSIRVLNRTPIDLNTHLHGFHVNPRGDGDNVFLSVPPGEELTTRVTLARYHQGGLDWYHPHVHGVTNESVFKGLAGPFIVRGGAESLPQVKGLVQRLLVVKAHQFVPDVTPPTMVPVTQASSAKFTFTVNSALSPNLVMRPGETQLWAIANMTPGAFLRLSLAGHGFTVLAEDGCLGYYPWVSDVLDIPPGKRFEVLVTAPAEPTTLTLSTLGFLNGTVVSPAQDLATVEVVGPSADSVRAPKRMATQPGWVTQTPARRRVFTLSRDNLPTSPVFYINGVTYGHESLHDVFDVPLGTVEEWVVRNDPRLASGGVSMETHPFHIHVNDHVVVGRGMWDPATGKTTSYQPLLPFGPKDTEAVAPNEYVVLKMLFTRFRGKTVFHCHILFHEDNGMMGAFRIVDRSVDDSDGEHSGH